MQHLVIGWSHGKVEVRNQLTGEVLFKETLAAAGGGTVPTSTTSATKLAGICIGRYRNEGNPNIIAISSAGEVYGFLAEGASLSYRNDFKSNSA